MKCFKSWNWKIKEDDKWEKEQTLDGEWLTRVLWTKEFEGFKSWKRAPVKQQMKGCLMHSVKHEWGVIVLGCRAGRLMQSARNKKEFYFTMSRLPLWSVLDCFKFHHAVVRRSDAYLWAMQNLFEEETGSFWEYWVAVFAGLACTIAWFEPQWAHMGHA